MTVEPTAAAPAPGTPIQFEIEYPDDLSRLLIFVKWLLVIPHLIILGVLGFVQYVITIFAFFTVLFTKKYPEGLFKISVGVMRWNQNANAYMLLMRDEYPPFSWDAGEYPVSYDVEYPEELSRWLIFVKWILAIPHIIVLAFLFTGVFLALFGAWFAILFTKRYPESLFNYMVGVLRWQLRVNAYTNLLRDEYPPFSLEA